MALTAQDFLNYQKQVDPSSGAYGQFGALAQNPNALPPAVVQGLITSLNPNDPNGLSPSALQSIQAATGGTYGAPTGTVSASNLFGDNSVNDSGVPTASAGNVDPSTGTVSSGSTNPVGSILSQIFGGNNFNLSNVLPAALGIGAGIFDYLGTDAAYGKAGNLINAAELGAGNQVNNAATAAGNNLVSTTGNANDILNQLFSNFTGSTNPYTTAGGVGANDLATALAPGGQLNPDQSMTADQIMQADPGYQFRLGQGEQDLQAQLAARGLSGSGEAVKQGEQLAQDYASQEYGNVFQRLQQNMQNLFSRLAGTSQLGQNANQQNLTAAADLAAPTASNLIGAATNQGLFNVQGSQYQGNAGVAGAGAQAGAAIDANQAKSQMIQTILNSLLSLFKNPNGATASPTQGSGNLVSGLLNQLLPIGA